MNSLFYYFLRDLGGAILFFFSVFLCLKIVKFLIWREFKQNYKYFLGSTQYWLFFNATCLGLLSLGFLLSFFCTGSFTYGLVSLLFVPLILRLLSKYHLAWSRYKLELSALSFFYGLLGLIQSGHGFSSALFELTREHPSLFSTTLGKHLRSYEEGKGLSIILKEFREKTNLSLIGIYLVTLEMAYAQGLALAPFLEQMIPSLEKEQHYQQKIGGLRKQSLAQAFLAFCVPWVLTFTLWCFNPEVFQSLHRRYLILSCIASAVLVSEFLGVWFLCRITRFG